MAETDRTTRVVRVVCATADVQRIVEVAFTEGLTAREAVESSGLAEEFPEIRARPLMLGVFGRAVDPDRVLEPGERVEICRPLLRDPRDARRILAGEGEVVGAGPHRDAGAANAGPTTGANPVARKPKDAS